MIVETGGPQIKEKFYIVTTIVLARRIEVLTN